MRTFIWSVMITLLCTATHGLHQQQQNHHQQQQPKRQPQLNYNNTSVDQQEYLIQSVLTLEPKCEPGYVVVNHRCHKQA